MNLRFDGKGPGPDDYYTPTGRIGGNPSSTASSSAAFREIGLHMVYPAFYEGKGISTVVRNAQGTRVVQEPGGIVVIRYLDADRNLPGDRRTWWNKIVLDLTKDGVITQVADYITVPDDTREYVNVQADIEYVPSATGIWMPKTGILVHGAKKNRRIFKYEFENVKVNHFNPSEEPQRFRIDFPKGAPVVDERTGVYFVVGSPPPELEGEILDSLKQSLEKMPPRRPAEGTPPAVAAGTSVGAEGTAVPQEPLAEKLGPESARAEAKYAGQRRAKWLFSALPVFVLIAVFYALRRKKPSQVSSILLLSLLSFSASYGGAEATQPPEKASAWEVQIGGDARIPVYQCGLNSTVFALQFFHRSYLMEQVKDGLQPSTKGISLLKIKCMLQAYGLDVDSRHLRRGKELNAIFETGSLVILPSSIYGLGHYYVVLPAASNHGQQQYLLVDPGRSVKVEGAKRIDERLALAHGIVLIVSKRRNGPLQADQIKFEPEEIDLGEFLTARKEPLRKEVTLKNIGQSSLMVSRISSSCNCSLAQWKGGLLEPGAEETITLTVSPYGWGIGQKKKLIVAFCGDGSQRTCTITGRGVMPEHLQKLEISPKKIYFNLTSPSVAATEPVRTIHVRRLGGGAMPPFKIDTKDCASWLDAELVEQPLHSTFGEIRVRLLPGAVKAPTAETSFSVFTTEDKEPVAISVVVTKSKSYSISKSVVVLDGPTDTECQSVLFYPDGASSKSVRILDVSSDNPALKPAFDNLADGTSTLRVSPSFGSLEKGTYRIGVKLRSGTGEEVMETIHVLVMK